MLPPPLAPRFPTILVGRQLGHLPAGPRLVAHSQWQPQGTHGCWGGALPPRVGRATPPTLCPPAGDTPGDVRVQPGLHPGLGPPRSAGERGGLGEPGQAGAGRGSWLPRPGRSSLLNSYCLNPKGGCYVLFPFRAGAAGSRASRRGSLPRPGKPATSDQPRQARPVLVLVPVPISVPAGRDPLSQPCWQHPTAPSCPVRALAGDTGAPSREELGGCVTDPREPAGPPCHCRSPRGGPGGQQGGSCRVAVPLAP